MIFGDRKLTALPRKEKREQQQEAHMTVIAKPIADQDPRDIASSSIEDAAHFLVHSIPGGAQAVAGILGKSRNTLSNEVNPYMPRHKFGLLDAVRTMKAFNQFSLLKTIAQDCGFAVIPVGRFEGVADTELLDLYANWHAEIGDTAIALRAALDDGRITEEEYRKIEKETIEANQASFEFLARLKSLVE